MRALLWIGLAVCFTYGFFWRNMIEDSFFLLQAISFICLSLYIYLRERTFVSYLWLAYCINNLVDELAGAPTRIDIGEKIIIVITPVIWLIKKTWNDRQINRGSN